MHRVRCGLACKWGAHCCCQPTGRFLDCVGFATRAPSCGPAARAVRRGKQHQTTWRHRSQPAGVAVGIKRRGITTPCQLALLLASNNVASPLTASWRCCWHQTTWRHRSQPAGVAVRPTPLLATLPCNPLWAAPGHRGRSATGKLLIDLLLPWQRAVQLSNLPLHALGAGCQITAKSSVVNLLDFVWFAGQLAAHTAGRACGEPNETKRKRLDGH